MAKPIIFIVNVRWDAEAQVWSGHCDELPVAADAVTLDELFDKVSRMALDIAPDNHPGVSPDDIFLQLSALREAAPAAA